MACDAIRALLTFPQPAIDYIQRMLARENNEPKMEKNGHAKGNGDRRMYGKTSCAQKRLQKVEKNGREREEERQRERACGGKNQADTKEI